MKTDSVMIDCETLGTIANSIILSIGAVKFSLNSDYIDDDAFYASISIDSNLHAGRQLSESTLLWWLDQSKEAQAVFREPKQALDTALDSLTAWFGTDDKQTVWSNGADFDLPMLAHAYAGYGWETPWKFWNNRCVRTYRSLPAAQGMPRLGNDHNALRDAINQAKYVQAIQKNMRGKVTA